jgi:hypothetical protein
MYMINLSQQGNKISDQMKLPGCCRQDSVFRVRYWNNEVQPLGHMHSDA